MQPISKPFLINSVWTDVYAKISLPQSNIYIVLIPGTCE